MTLSDEFCPQCGTILPVPRTAPSTLRCALCKAGWAVKPVRNKLVYTIEKVYEHHVTDATHDSIQDPVVDKFCERCGHDKMSFLCRQTRSADEGQTVFYTCLKCKNNLVENA